MLEGVFGVHQAPPMPPKKVRKFCSFDPLNGELRRQTPMDLKSGITSKTKLLQKNWTHLQNLCIKVDQMAYSKSLEIFMRQEWRNFDMWVESVSFKQIFEDKRPNFTTVYSWQPWANADFTKNFSDFMGHFSTWSSLGMVLCIRLMQK